jgi:hypothetical protein
MRRHSIWYRKGVEVQVNEGCEQSTYLTPAAPSQYLTKKILGTRNFQLRLNVPFSISKTFHMLFPRAGLINRRHANWKENVNAEFRHRAIGQRASPRER